MQNSTIFKLAVFAGLVLVAAKIGNYFASKDVERLHQELIGQTEKYKQLSEYSASLEIKYKESADLYSETSKKFKDELDQLQGKIKILSDATFLIKEKARETNNSDVVFSGPDSQYILNEVRFDDGTPVGYVLIFKDGRVVSKLYKSIFNVDSLVTIDETSGRYSIASKAQFILKSPSLSPNGNVWLNKSHQLPIIGGTAQIDPTEPSLLTKRIYLWNPKLNAGINMDPAGIYPSFGVSLMGYGFTRNDLDYRILQLGFQVKNGSLDGILTPVLWRPISGIMSNTYLGPGVSLGASGLSYFLSIQVGL